MAFNSYSTSIRGASHDSSGKPCQDYSSCITCEDYAVAVVSDGHGGSRYFRSEIGSKLAVQAAVDVISSCMGAGRVDFITGIGQDPHGIMTRLSDAVLTRWTGLVQEYDTKNPHSEEERSLEGQDDDILRAYGATLICGVLSDDLAFGFQIGDGELVLVNDASSELMPIPEDPDCFLNRTSSICGSDASSRFRHFVISATVEGDESDNLRTIRADPRRISSISVCTDGLSTSFNSDESLMRYCMAIPEVLSSGGVRKLEENLELRSRSNTCDDVSISVVYRPIRLGCSRVSTCKDAKSRAIRKKRKNIQKRKERRCGRRRYPRSTMSPLLNVR
ncbi:PP2C family serine/threonine-protein phosphatase [Candidatus Methanarcanum hacksteinii]|uniref:PP2C family serine/threonine-protein phosphatase n=1 Tax=Candidatus Methanarcanum hacksteinii TaxID=2911857 RepID=UPI0037DC0EAD